MQGFMRGLSSTVLAFAVMGATLFGASFALSAIGDQRGAALAFMSGGILLAIFGAPAWLVALARWRAADIATLDAVLDRHGPALYKRYGANAAIGARDFTPSADWRDDVRDFRRALPSTFLFLGRKRFHALITARMEAMRQSAQAFGRPQSADPATSPARLAEAELRALGWRAETRDGPGLLGPGRARGTRWRAHGAALRGQARASRSLAACARAAAALSRRSRRLDRPPRD